MRTEQQQQKYIRLGLNVAFYRKLRNLSQAQLAELVGISRTHVSRIETADCAVSLDVVFKICDVLSVAPSTLMNFNET